MSWANQGDDNPFSSNHAAPPTAPAPSVPPPVPPAPVPTADTPSWLSSSSSNEQQQQQVVAPAAPAPTQAPAVAPPSNDNAAAQITKSAGPTAVPGLGESFWCCCCCSCMLPLFCFCFVLNFFNFLSRFISNWVFAGAAAVAQSRGGNSGRKKHRTLPVCALEPAFVLLIPSHCSSSPSPTPSRPPLALK